MKRLVNKVWLIFSVFVSIVLFGLMVFGMVMALMDKQYALVLILIVCCFLFSYLMFRIPAVKNFLIGGDKLKISVNEENNGSED